ncbi:MAG: Hint domain-containing protein [Cypionkella sp.]
MSYAAPISCHAATRVFAAAQSLPGFAIGTVVLTKLGERRIESLRAGDKIISRDHGFVTLRQVGLSAGSVADPVHLMAGALGRHEALTVTAATRLRLQGTVAERRFGCAVITVAALDLVDGDQVFRMQAPCRRFLHLQFDAPETIYANGLEAECLDPTATLTPSPLRLLDDAALTAKPRLHSFASLL